MKGRKRGEENYERRGKWQSENGVDEKRMDKGKGEESSRENGDGGGDRGAKEVGEVKEEESGRGQIKWNERSESK